MSSDGQQQSEVISESGKIRDPRWSPDGKLLAYTVGTDLDLVTIGLEGSGRKVVTKAAQFIAWSPDGSKFAFTELGNIFVINADGTGKTQLTTTVGSQNPRWSPDGSKITFDRGEVFVMDNDGKNETKLNTGAMSHPAWSPSGAQIAAVKDGKGLYVSDPDGNNPLGPFGLRPRNDEFEWSPDGSLLLFTNQSEVFTDTGISVIKPDGTGEVVLLPPMGSVPFSQPAWSPKGTRVSYTRNPPGSGGLAVWTMDSAGQNPAELVKGFAARWSPNCNE